MISLDEGRERQGPRFFRFFKNIHESYLMFFVTVIIKNNKDDRKLNNDQQHQKKP